MRAGRRIATLALAAGLCLATAQDAPQTDSPRVQGPATLEAFGDMDKTCGEWTDGCATCLRRKDGSAGCSTPGIACQPSALTCSKSDNLTPKK